MVHPKYKYDSKGPTEEMQYCTKYKDNAVNTILFIDTNQRRIHGGGGEEVLEFCQRLQVSEPFRNATIYHVTK